MINTNTEKFPYPVPPVGLCLLARVLERKYIVRIFDGVFGVSENMERVLRHFQPDYVGVGIRNIDDMVMDHTTCYVDQVYSNFILPVKNQTNAPLILGGSGFSIFPDELMERYGADYGIIGEAEYLLPKLLHYIEEGKDCSFIPGVVKACWKAGQGVHTPDSPDLSDLPFSEMDRHIDFAPYLERGAYSIQTKRGCNHSCIYCTYPLIEGKKYRLRRVVEIAEEIVQAHRRLGVLTFEFVDSTFNDPPGWAEQICREIISRKIEFRFRTMGINPQHTSAKLFQLMVDAGFAQIDCTPDSASPQMLKNLKKNFRLEHLVNTARFLKDTDLPAMWFFTFGGPGETEKTISETFAFIDRWISTKDMVHMTAGLRIYPNTELHRIAMEEKLVHPEDPLLEPVFYVSDMLGKDKINSILAEAARSRPNCIPAAESAPSPEMLNKASILREEQTLTEPMFRTLIRIRNEQNHQ